MLQPVKGSSDGLIETSVGMLGRDGHEEREHKATGPTVDELPRITLGFRLPGIKELET